MNTAKLKYRVDPIRRGNPPSYVDAEGIPVVNQGCVWPNGLKRSKFKCHNPDAVDKIDAWLQEGDVLVNSTGTGTLGRVCHLNFKPDIDCFADGHVTVLRDSRQRINTRYLFYILSIQQERITVECSEGATNQIELSRALLGGFKIDWPELNSQTKIADYLDRKTAELDQLILVKKNLLKLLDEKKRALIAHAVTRGLNPDAPLKDSGIPWLGMIPEHWELTKLKHVAEVRGGLTMGKKYGNAELKEFPYLRVANVQDGFLNLTNVINVFVNPRDAESYLLQKGDVLMNEGGDIDKLGRGCVWNEEIRPCLHQNHVFSVRPKKIDSEWLNLWTSSEKTKRYFELKAKRSTNLASISGTNVKELPIAIPPRDEQNAIFSFIGSIANKIDELENKAVTTISLLQERRTALISEAVTGKLKEVYK